MSIRIRPSSTSVYDNSSVLCVAAPSSSHALMPRYSMSDTLSSKGYAPLTQVAEALQGSIIRTSKTGTTHIVKSVDKSLYFSRVTVVNNRRIKVDEDIIKEMTILKYLRSKHPPSALIKFVDFFHDPHNYFLVMEDGGASFFDIVRKCHKYLRHGRLDLSVWRSFVQNAMHQMVNLLQWMHNTVHCCHLDISLENFVITNLKVTKDQNSQNITSFNDDFEIKLIDFGLAEVFSVRNESDMVDFRCCKYVGKPGYKSPEIHAHRMFDARAADVWCLGVCFFIMIVGLQPFERAMKTDRRFVMIMNGEYTALLSTWDRLHYVTPNILNLFRRIFVQEKDRSNISQIQQHSYFENLHT